MNRPNGMRPLAWAATACDSIISRYAPIELPPAHRWHYHQGVFLSGMEMLARTASEERYSRYIQGYVDELVDANGNLYFARDELDAIQAGLLLFDLDARIGGGGKYRTAANKLRRLFDTLNRNSEGGFWHKDKYPYQMWLDGLYMGGVFALKYANAYGDHELRDMVLHQERLMRRFMSDERTGLLFHAWDESRRMSWADADSGCSPELWGRSLGWYGLALSQFIDCLPEGHAGRAELSQALARFVQSIIQFQDSNSGLWFQVIDKGHLNDNWLETSCSCLFIYAIAKAVKLGIVPASCAEAAVRGYHGLFDFVKTDETGRFVLSGICIGTSAGDYNNYVTRPTSENDLHGVGAFVMACVEVESLV